MPNSITITNILRQKVSIETPIEVQFWAQALKVNFQKIWGSISEQDSTIWHNSCGNFDESSIRTRLKSAQAQKSKQIINLY